MRTYTLAETKAQLSRLITLAEAGEEITIPKRGRAVVKLVPSEPRLCRPPCHAHCKLNVCRFHARSCHR